MVGTFTTLFSRVFIFVRLVVIDMHLFGIVIGILAVVTFAWGVAAASKATEFITFFETNVAMD